MYGVVAQLDGVVLVDSVVAQADGVVLVYNVVTQVHGVVLVHSVVALVNREVLVYDVVAQLDVVVLVSCPIRRCVAIAQCRGSSGWCELLVYGVLAHQDGEVLVVRSG